MIRSGRSPKNKKTKTSDSLRKPMREVPALCIFPSPRLILYFLICIFLLLQAIQYVYSFLQALYFLIFIFFLIPALCIFPSPILIFPNLYFSPAPSYTVCIFLSPSLIFPNLIFPLISVIYSLLPQNSLQFQVQI